MPYLQLKKYDDSNDDWYVKLYCDLPSEEQKRNLLDAMFSTATRSVINNRTYQYEIENLEAYMNSIKGDNAYGGLSAMPAWIRGKEDNKGEPWPNMVFLCAKRGTNRDFYGTGDERNLALAGCFHFFDYTPCKKMSFQNSAFFEKCVINSREKVDEIAKFTPLLPKVVARSISNNKHAVSESEPGLSLVENSGELKQATIDFLCEYLKVNNKNDFPNSLSEKYPDGIFPSVYTVSSWLSEIGLNEIKVNEIVEDLFQ